MTDQSGEPLRRKPRPLSRLDHKIMQRVIVWVARIVFTLYGHWRVVGLENIPREGGVLFASNHASYVDPPLAWAAAYRRRHIWGIAKSELWDNRVIAYLLDCIGVLPIHRGSTDKALFRMSLDLLARGETVGMFPEGSRSADGELQPARPGIALLVQKSGVPVVPIAVMGTFEMLPRGASRPRPARLIVAFGKPLTFPPKTSREAITDAIMASIAEMMTSNGRPTKPPVAGQTVASEEP